MLTAPTPFRSLYGRLALLLFAVVSLLMVGFAVALFSLTRTHMDEVEQRLNRDLAGHLVAGTPILTETGVDQAALGAVLHKLMVVNPRIELYVLDLEGKILAFEAPEGVVKATRVAMPSVDRFLTANAESTEVPVFPIRGTDPRMPDREATFSAAEITDAAGNHTGYLYVVLQGTKYRNAVGGLWASYAVRLAVSAVIVAFVVAFGAGLLVLRRVTARVERLAHQSHQFAESGFAAPPHALVEAAAAPAGSALDEIGQLEQVFGAMSQKMMKQLQEREQLDRHRRELVANVSHDLRTPVAILRGYLETLQLKPDSLDEGEQAKILDIAVRQSERLGRLVSDLFELAKLDAGLIDCRRDLVSISELVQDVAQKFELPAKQQSVDLVTQLDPVAPRVSIDVRLMERVVENLLDNALRHTPPGGRVEVSVGTSAGEGGPVKVCVADTGSGIAAEDLPRIFDRFYKGHSEAADRKKNLGLGLAIASKALALHESQVAVHSDGESGTSFWFELQPGLA